MNLLKSRTDSTDTSTILTAMGTTVGALTLLVSEEEEELDDTASISGGVSLAVRPWSSEENDASDEEDDIA